MVLLIDNFDSFTYNLYQLASMAATSVTQDPAVAVYRCDKIDLNEICRLDPSHVILSPGPGRPTDARLTCDVIRHFKAKKPILGVCLGHQCLAEVLGAKIVESRTPVHGKCSDIFHDGHGVFQGVPSPFKAVRYHSLTVSGPSLASNLVVTARTGDDEIMGLRLVNSKVESVQFHPESVLTDWGITMMCNFLRSGCTS